jgi:hypothetical protein
MFAPRTREPRSKNAEYFILFYLRFDITRKSLALIGDASVHRPGRKGRNSIRGIFDKETRTKQLAFAADAVSYGI